MNLSRQEIFIAFTVIAFVVTIAYRFPRQGLWLFLIYIPLAGTVSYSLVSIFQSRGSQLSYSQDYALFHLAKDAFYIPALISICLSSSPLKQLKKFKGNLKFLSISILILVGFCLLTLFLVNFPQRLSALPQEKPFLMGIVGLKILIGYIPLLACGYYLIRDRQDLQYLFRLQLVISLVCCVLCIIQYILLTQGICTGTVDSSAPPLTRAILQGGRCLVGGGHLLYSPQNNLIRLPGTFVDPWQWTWFLISSSFLTSAATVYESSLSWRISGFISIFLVLVTAIVSERTTANFLVPVILLVLLLVLLWTTEQKNKWLPFKLGIATVLCILIANNFGVFGSALDIIVSSWNSTLVLSFIFAQFNWVIGEGVPLLGYGLGKVTNPYPILISGILIETFYPRLLYEIGWLGTLAFVGVVSVVTISTFKAYRSLKQLPLRSLGICLWLFVLLISYNTFYYPLTVEPVNIYYWFFAGVLLKLPTIDRTI